MTPAGWALTILIVLMLLALLVLYLVGRPMMKSVSHDDDIVAIEALELPPRPPLAGSPAAEDQARGGMTAGRGVSSLTLMTGASALERARRSSFSGDDTQ